MFETLPVDTGDILFIGDSITEGFPIAEMSGNCAIKNRGVSGAIADEVLRIILMKNTTKSTKIFLMAGINDLKKLKGERPCKRLNQILQKDIVGQAS